MIPRFAIPVLNDVEVLPLPDVLRHLQAVTRALLNDLYDEARGNANAPLASRIELAGTAARLSQRARTLAQLDDDLPSDLTVRVQTQCQTTHEALI